MCSNRDQQCSPPGPNWRVEVDAEKCSLCEVCVHHCPPAAIRSEQSGDTLFILFQPNLCDGCQACLERCPEDAIRLVRVDAPREGEEEVLVKSQMLHCEVCGTWFAPVSKLRAASRKTEDNADIIREQCPLCRRTQMVARFIDEKREASGRPAEYRTGQKWHFKSVTDGDPDGPPCPEVLKTPSNLGRSDPSPEESPASREEGQGNADARDKTP